MAHDTLLWLDLSQLIQALGTKGGLMSPSIYDTAQLLRFYPPENPWPAVEWLIDQQQADGGWGPVSTPKARYMPTMAALLALDATSTHKRSTTATTIERGIKFVRRHQWRDWAMLDQSLPGGIELILPILLDELEAQAMPIEREAYTHLITLGEKRRTFIRTLPRLHGTTATHIWEGWGTEPELKLIDGSKTVGHSPAASAIWLHFARQHANIPQNTLEIIEQGLQSSSAATITNIPGVINTCWPISEFERTFSLYALFLAHVIPHTADIPTALRQQLDQQLDLLEKALTPQGVGFSDWFQPDGDDTSVAIAILKGAGRPVNYETLMLFEHPERTHFVAWQGEFQSSPTVTAHALHALADTTIDKTTYIEWLLAQQQPTGLWKGEKWNASPIYTTSQCGIALLACGYTQAAETALISLLRFQHESGAWGEVYGESAEETAYAVLALLYAQKHGLALPDLATTLKQAQSYLYQVYRPFVAGGVPVWLGKETYRPERVARSFELAAMLALEFYLGTLQ